MANVVFKNTADIAYLDVALQSTQIIHVPSKPVWAAVSMPRRGPHKYRLLERLQEEVRFIESEIYADAPLLVSKDESLLTIEVGPDVCARVISKSVVWSKKGCDRYANEYRAQATQAVLQ